MVKRKPVMSWSILGVISNVMSAKQKALDDMITDEIRLYFHLFKDIFSVLSHTFFEVTSTYIHICKR